MWLIGLVSWAYFSGRGGFRDLDTGILEFSLLIAVVFGLIGVTARTRKYKQLLKLGAALFLAGMVYDTVNHWLINMEPYW